MTDVLEFPSPKKPEKRDPLNILEVEQIGFLCKSDRGLWVKRKEDLLKIMKFIVAEKIAIIEKE